MPPPRHPRPGGPGSSQQALLRQCAPEEPEQAVAVYHHEQATLLEQPSQHTIDGLREMARAKIAMDDDHDDGDGDRDDDNVDDR